MSKTPIERIAEALERIAESNERIVLLFESSTFTNSSFEFSKIPETKRPRYIRIHYSTD